MSSTVTNNRIEYVAGLLVEYQGAADYRAKEPEIPPYMDSNQYHCI